MVSELDSGASGPGSSPCRGHSVVFLGNTLYSRRQDSKPVIVKCPAYQRGTRLTYLETF